MNSEIIEVLGEVKRVMWMWFGWVGLNRSGVTKVVISVDKLRHNEDGPKVRVQRYSYCIDMSIMQKAVPTLPR